jgi:hypothetical protein
LNGINEANERRPKQVPLVPPSHAANDNRKAFL